MAPQRPVLCPSHARKSGRAEQRNQRPPNGRRGAFYAASRVCAEKVRVWTELGSGNLSEPERRANCVRFLEEALARRVNDEPGPVHCLGSHLLGVQKIAQLRIQPYSSKLFD